MSVTDPADALPTDPDLDQLAAALREEPVLVSPLFGNGRTDQVREGLRALVDEADFPVYVVLVPTSAGSGESPQREVATLLHDRLGDGVFLIGTDPKAFRLAIETYGPYPQWGGETSERLHDLADGQGTSAGVSNAGDAAQSLELLLEGTDFSRSDFDSYRTEAVWRETDAWSGAGDPPTTPYTTGVAVAVVVTTAAFLVLRNIARWRETAPSPSTAAFRGGRPPVRSGGRVRADPAAPAALSTPQAVRAAAEEKLGQVARRLERAGRLPVDRRHLADGSYDVARTVLRRAGSGSSDLPDLVGALVLARIAGHAVEGGDQPYRPCFIDPRHGRAREVRRIPHDPEDVEVPVCSTCGTSDRPQPLLLPVRRGLLTRPTPYYETDSVWARTGYGALVENLWRQVADDLREAGS